MTEATERLRQQVHDRRHTPEHWQECLDVCDEVDTLRQFLENGGINSAAILAGEECPEWYDENERLTPYYEAIDHAAVVTWTLNNDYSAQEQLEEIINWHIQVATDPKVNGGYELVRVK